jgi:predicted choloylglycine hydrolase
MMPFDDQTDAGQELAADYRILNVQGKHYHIGKYMGESTPLRALPRHGPGEPDLDYAWDCLQEIGVFHPGIESEYQGFAEAKNVPFDKILPHISINVTNGQVGQCSTIGYRTRAGEIIIGRNYDFRFRQQLRYLVHTNPPGYAAHIGTNSGLVGGRYDGVNEYGVFVSLHTVMADRPKSIKPGIPFHLVVRITLEICRSAKEAMNLIRRMPLFHSFNYFLADNDEMYVLETHPTQTQATGGRADILAVTNHYRHPALQALHGQRPLSYSRRRLAYLCQEASAWEKDVDSFQAIQKLMCDHSTPVCGHHDGSATLWSAVCHPAKRTVAYALGAPCRNPYQDIGWPGASWAR